MNIFKRGTRGLLTSVGRYNGLCIDRNVPYFKSTGISVKTGSRLIVGIVKLTNVTKMASANIRRLHGSSVAHGNIKFDMSFLRGDSAQALERMFNSWLQDPNTVHNSWWPVFQAFKDGTAIEGTWPVQSKEPKTSGRGVVERTEIPKKDIGVDSKMSSVAAKPEEIRSPPAKSSDTAMKDVRAESGVSPGILEDHMKVQELVRNYQKEGHLRAALDPLEIWRPIRGPAVTPDIEKMMLDPKRKDQLYLLPEETFIGMGEQFLSMDEIVKRLHKVYSHTIGFEFSHITKEERRSWIIQLVEKSLAGQKRAEYDKVKTLSSLLRCHLFEVFLREMKPGRNTYDIEGCEVLIPALEMLMNVAVDKGAESFNIGMSQRGRLNVLSNIMKVGINEILGQMSESPHLENMGAGEKAFQLGTCVRLKKKQTSREFDVCLVPGPDYFEVAHALAQGRNRAEQFHTDDDDGKKVWPVSIHGDSTLYSQGLGYELIQMSELQAYSNHGTIHFIIDNQVGHHSLTRRFKNTEYCSDIGKSIGAPIFHVNADDVDAVMDIVSKAVEYRAKFKADVFVDLVCYRRYGYTGRFLPSEFKQQVMDDKIKRSKTVYQKYCNQLINEKVISQEDIFKMEKSYFNMCNTEMKKPVKSGKDGSGLWKDNNPWWNALLKKSENLKTGIELDKLKHVGSVASRLPEGFNPNRSIERLVKQRITMMKTNSLDWSFCEALAIGSVLMEGHHVRLSGQDVERGTFSHRNQVWHDVRSPGVRYNPLLNLDPSQAEYSLNNSILSEFAVLGYEYGYSTFNPNDLVIWEGQFGDFVNGAQVIIDHYVAAGEIRWSTKSSLVLLLPHGLEGQGPEHSSGRPERFLQLSSDDDRHFSADMGAQLSGANIIVACPTVPHSYFHVLRRQIKLPSKKPLILFTPKSLLRHPQARSRFEDMTTGTEFQTYIPDGGADPKKVTKLIMCTGKVYYDLTAEREAKGIAESVAIGRLEQICPFPYEMVRQDVARFPEATLCWAQEEHKNQGWWTYVQPRIITAISGIRKGDLSKVKYAGRKRAAAPAVGNKMVHLKERELFLEKAMSIP